MIITTELGVIVAASAGGGGGQQHLHRLDGLQTTDHAGHGTQYTHISATTAPTCWIMMYTEWYECKAVL
jgi:hypothetical protein